MWFLILSQRQESQEIIELFQETIDGCCIERGALWPGVGNGWVNAFPAAELLSLCNIWHWHSVGVAGEMLCTVSTFTQQAPLVS